VKDVKRCCSNLDIKQDIFTLNALTIFAGQSASYTNMQMKYISAKKLEHLTENDLPCYKYGKND